MKRLNAFFFFTVIIFVLLGPAAIADGICDAKINESISVYIPDAGTSRLLIKGTPAQVLEIAGDNAVISLELQNGYCVQTQIPTKYLTMSPPKKENPTGSGVLGPNPVTASPIEPLILPRTQAPLVVATDDFFNVETVTFHQIGAPDESQATKEVPQLDADNKPMLDQSKSPILKEVPIPFIAANVSVKEQVKTDAVVIKAYFYDQTLKLIATDDAPFTSKEVQLPVFIPKDTNQRILFAVPDTVLSQDNWSAVVIFGDAKGVDAQVYSNGNQVADYNFPEKNILENKNGPPIERKIAMDPLIEHVVQTENPNQPQITLFLRPPLGMTDASQAKGVLCMSLLAGSLDGVKRQLQGLEAGDDLSGILKFAEDHKLIIICWGSRGLWDPHKNWDDLSPDTTWATDKAFDQVANAWEIGIQYFVKKYGIPSNSYLLWGISGSGQYACRLALRKPDRFLAVHVHIPSSFDKPTAEGRKVLWCLTTGELESGYQRSLRFYAQCRALGYPIMYKAIVGLGHAGSPIADDIGLKFFDYALSVRDQRSAYEASLNNPLAQFQLAQIDSGHLQPWLDSFCKPAYVGDSINQGIFPYEQRDMVPMGFRVPLPTKDIADAWNK